MPELGSLGAWYDTRYRTRGEAPPTSWHAAYAVYRGTEDYLRAHVRLGSLADRRTLDAIRNDVALVVRLLGFAEDMDVLEPMVDERGEATVPLAPTTPRGAAVLRAGRELAEKYDMRMRFR